MDSFERMQAHLHLTSKCKCATLLPEHPLDCQVKRSRAFSTIRSGGEAIERGVLSHAILSTAVCQAEKSVPSRPR
jgi:hypothetical protein